MTDDRVPENDEHVVGAWKGLVLIGIMLFFSMWGSVGILGWATSATGWLGVVAWVVFAVSCAMVLACVGLGLVIGLPWIRYRKRVQAANRAVELGGEL